jgi:flagellar FliL protein
MTGNPLFDKILIGLNGAVAIGAAALVFHSHTGIKPEPTNQKAEEEALVNAAVEESQLKAYDFKSIVVNLYSEGSRLRYLDVEMGVLPFKEADKALFKEREYVFKNALIQIAAKMTPDELTSVTGKILLESRLKNAVNEALGKTVVKKIYFAKFVVQ